MIAVRWTAAAQNELTEIWANARSADRGVITHAVDELERELRRRPWQLGEGDPDGIRRAAMAPIGIEFRVSEADSFVHVFRVWEIKLAR